MEPRIDSLTALPSLRTDGAPVPSSTPMCRGIRSNCRFGTYGEQQCIDCAFLEERQFGSNLETEFLKHCRGIRQFIEQTASEFFSSHVTSILLTPSARVLDCDQRGQSFLRTGGLLSVLHNKLRCSDQTQDAKVHDAIAETAKTGRATTLLLNPLDRPQQRYSLVLVRLSKRIPSSASITEIPPGNVLCLVAPLDRRRIATANQLMDLFGLSAAEARLARALTLQACSAYVQFASLSGQALVLKYRAIHLPKLTSIKSKTELLIDGGAYSSPKTPSVPRNVIKRKHMLYGRLFTAPHNPAEEL